MEAHVHECDDQKSSGLSRLPPELLTLIIENLDTPDIRSFRLTCCLASHWVDSTFRKLLKSIKIFLHPYSLGLLEGLSTSPFADCVKRIVISTETFQSRFHLSSAEYRPTLATTFRRFTHLHAVEIRDFAPHDAEGKCYDDALIQSQWTRFITSAYATIRSRPERNGQHYYSRWGDEGDNLHAMGIRHVSTQYTKLERKVHPDLYDSAWHYPTPMEQLGQLFSATLQACASAKAAGVNVTDFRVATMYAWAISGMNMAAYLRAGDGSEQEKFLSSLEVLHLPTYWFCPDFCLLPFLNACKRLKWLRLEFVDLGAQPYQPWDLGMKLSACFSEMGVTSQLNRLDLGGLHIGDVALTSVILQARPKILNIWLGDLQVDSAIQYNTTLDWGWQMLLRNVAGVVEHVRLDKVIQNSPRMSGVLLKYSPKPLTLPGVGHGYVALTTENVERVVRRMWMLSWANDE